MSRWLVLGVAALASVSVAHAADYAITPKERVLANLLAGKWVENQYFNKDDCAHICGMQFSCPAAISDCPFADVLGDPEKFQVRRTYFNYSGGISHVETVVLKPQQYWALVKQVENALDAKTPPLLMSEPLELYQ